MSFVQAMSTSQSEVKTPDLTKKGVNGSDVYTDAGVGDDRVVLFTQLVRDQKKEYIQNLVQNLINKQDPQILRDVIVMAFQTRNVRGGKGEKDIFYFMFQKIVDNFPDWSDELLALVPEYGCWQDMWKLYENASEFTRYSIEKVVKEQFQLDQESEKPSLLPKWMPREGSKYDWQARRFARLLFPMTPKNQIMRIYRKTLAYLNTKIDTTEIKMCGRKWATITPSHVPGRLMKRNKMAFFNQKNGPHGTVEPRWPESQDRILCAENFQTLLKDVKEGKVVMKGGDTTMPHEHVHEILHSCSTQTSVEIEETRQAQWNAIRDLTLSFGKLDKVVAMCDFSGSMDGVPKEVSLALGILISEIATPAFKDHILTFDDTPKWHSFASFKTLREKVNSVKGNLGIGLSTNLTAAVDMILRKLVEHKVPASEAPSDLIVLTDMGFNHANRSGKSFEPHFERIRNEFKEKGYTAPRIVCWNLRDEYKDNHATVHQEGVVNLSGWSPSILRAIQKEGVVVKTPYEGLRIILDDTQYDKVREVVSSLQKRSTKDLLHTC
jgi:hypothetical protein